MSNKRLKVYNLAELMEILQVSEFTIKRYIKNGRLKSANTGGAIRVSEENLKKFLGEDE